MLLVDLLVWWYSRGWAWAVRQLFIVRTTAIAHFFSIGDLSRTLFAPFRQDAVDTRRAPLGVKLQAFGGNIIARIFGFFIRTALIVVGVFCMAVNLAASAVATLLWPLIPVGPLIAVVLLVRGFGS